MLSLVITFTHISLPQEWKQIIPQFDPPGIYNLSFGYFEDENNGIALEDLGGRIWKTTDGGYNWEKIKDSIEYSMFWVSFVDINTILGTDGENFFRTFNGGLNWDIIKTPLIKGIYFINKNIGTGGWIDKIYYTTDGGLNWIKSEIDTEIHFEIWNTILVDNVGYAVGQ